MKNITDGQGLPWPKPAYLKRLASQEKTRVIVLRLLEEQLGVRKFGKMVSASSDQIVSVVSHIIIMSKGMHCKSAVIIFLPSYLLSVLS